MNPEVWGPHGWIFLHTITFNYPDFPTNDDKNKYKNFFTLLKYTLPCDACKQHFSNNLIKYPLTDSVLSSKNNLMKWLFNIHNSVNKMNNKKLFTYKEFIDYYNKLYTVDSRSWSWLCPQNLVLIIFIIFLLYFCIIKYFPSINFIK